MKKAIRIEIADCLVYVALMLAAVYMAGCAQFQGNPIPETPKGQYVTARKFYNDQVEALTAYAPVLTPAQKVSMHKDLAPVMDAIETTLDGWKVALMDPSKDPAGYNSAWMKLRGQMVAIIAKYLSD